MTRLTVIERVMDYKASQAIWSHSTAERMLAASFLRLGDQLEAQWESNGIQRRLCDIAVTTNNLLTDMRDSLGELHASQERHNALLAKSLAVQTDHYMLDKRERVLKDAVFRWTEIFNSSDGTNDPHWVLIASRTLLEFIKKWDFTTEDLGDADEKRALLNLIKHARDGIKSAPQSVINDVNIFQALYHDYLTLQDTEATKAIREQQFSFPDFRLPEAHFDHVKQVFLKHTEQAYTGEMVVVTSPKSECGEGTPAEFEQAGSLQQAALKTPDGLTPLVGIYAGTSLLREGLGKAVSHWFWEGTRASVALIIDDGGWLEVRMNHVIGVKVDRKTYLHDTFRPCEQMSIPEQPRKWIDRMAGFAADMQSYWRDMNCVALQAAAQHEAERDAAKQAFEPAKAAELKKREEYLAVSARRVNEYLDLHPQVDQFYSRAVESQQSDSSLATETKKASSGKPRGAKKRPTQ